MLLYQVQGQITREVHDSKQSKNALYHVEYDDGEAHDEDLKNDRFRWHGPRAASSLLPYRKDMRPAMLDLDAENVHGDKENVPVCTPESCDQLLCDLTLTLTCAKAIINMQGTVVLPKGGIPVLSEAVGWRIGFWWEGTREWVDGEVLAYRACDARHLVVFYDGEFEWMSLATEIIRWVGNTRERGNRLSPISFGLDEQTSPPKGREAVDWVVDYYDKNTNQMQRVEISGFDSVTGKHKVVFSDSRKVSWISLTASKIVWRFPPGLPTPATDAANPSSEVVDYSKTETARQGFTPRAVSSVPGHSQFKTKGARQKRKTVAAIGTPGAVVVEGSTFVSPSDTKGAKKGGCKNQVATAKATMTPKGSNVKAKSTVAAAPPVSKVANKPAASASTMSAPGETTKRLADTAAASVPPAKRVCAATDVSSVAAAPTAVPAAANVHPRSTEALAEETTLHRRRRSVCPASVAQSQQHVSSTQPDALTPAAQAPPEPKVVHFAAPREPSGPMSISNIRPAPVWPVAAVQSGIREAAFFRCSLAPAQSMVKHPGTFKNSVQCLLAATERRQVFVRALMKHLGDSPAPVAGAPLATPSLRQTASVPAGQPAALMTIPTDPRRASKPQIIEDPNRTIPPAQAGMPASSNPQSTRQRPHSAAVPPADVTQASPAMPQVATAAVDPAAPTAATPAAPTPAQPATAPPVCGAKTPVLSTPASVSQFTPKFAPLSSFQRRHTILGSAPVALPAVAPDSRTVQELLKQRSPTDAVEQSMTLSMSVVAKAVSAAVPSSLPQAVRSPPSDQTSSSCKIDDVRCASLAKLGGVKQQQTARVSSATWQVSQMQNAGTQKQGIGVNGQCDVRTESCHAATRVQDGSRTKALNRTASSNVRTANLRWGGAPLVAARASIGLKGGSSGGSTGGRACG